MCDGQSIRPFLRRLETEGALLRVTRPVDRMRDIAAFLSLADAGPALLFEAVQGSALRVAGNLLNGRGRIAAALGIGPGEIVGRIHAAIGGPVPPVRAVAAPVQEVVRTEAPLAGLPVPKFFRREGRPYVTAGVILAKDPVTGRGNASFARLGILDDATAMIGIAPNHHLAQLARKAAGLGRKLPIAVVIGAHPGIQLAACLYLGLGEDELGCAGRLLGEAVRVAPAKTVELDVPAEAELVLEAEVDCESPVPEGLVSEYHGMYEEYGPGWLATFSAVTHRKDAIFQVIEPGYHREHIYLGALPIAASLINAVSAVVPNARDVAVTEAGAGRTDVVVQIDGPRPGQARRAMFAVWAAVSIAKRVTVVDADIDPWDPGAVEWARCNRMRYERDLVMVEGVGADRSEPMEAAGLVTKVGFDATAKPGDRAEGNERALPEEAALAEARRWLTEALPPERRGWLGG